MVGDPLCGVGRNLAATCLAEVGRKTTIVVEVTIGSVDQDLGVLLDNVPVQDVELNLLRNQNPERALLCWQRLTNLPILDHSKPIFRILDDLERIHASRFSLMIHLE